MHVWLKILIALAAFGVMCVVMNPLHEWMDTDCSVAAEPGVGCVIVDTLKSVCDLLATVAVAVIDGLIWMLEYIRSLV